MKTMYFFCCNESNDPVAKGIFDRVIDMYNPQESGIIFDGKPVLQYTKEDHVFLFAQTEEVLSHNYTKYLPELAQFSECDFAGIVNWHEGKNAPDQILTVHTNSDVATGNFSRANPLLTRNIIQAIESNRKLMNLNDFSTKTEATHWSGVTYNQSPDLIPEFSVPLVDIEIGSSRESWKNPIAAQIIAKSLTEVFDQPDQEIIPILCVGGVHFDQDFANIAINAAFPFAVTHILPNQWIQDYVKPGFGMESLTKCKDSIMGGIQAIFYHDGMGGPLKDLVRTFAAQNNLPLFKHKALRDPAKLLQELTKQSASSSPSRPRPRI
ncbi:MAG: D-aminoacyl-tRNA deacylase [Gammaproteobacteria bacterium]